MCLYICPLTILLLLLIQAFSESLCELHGLILAEHFDNIIIAGRDFNVDFSRPGPNCSNLSTFMLSNNLISVDQMFNIKFTYHNDIYSCFSSPDHILTLSNYAYLIDSVSVLDSVKNFSDHLSLHFTLKFLTFSRFLLIYVRRSIIVLLVTLTLLPTLQLTGLKSPHVMFHPTVTNFCPPYLNFLQISLTAVTQTALLTTLILTPTVCNFLTVLIAAAADLCLPKHHQCQRHSPLSGWNVAALFLKQSAHFWHKVWTECGCPTSGVLFQIRKNSKRRFKYEVRYLCRRQSHIRREKLASAHLHSSHKSFGSL